MIGDKRPLKGDNDFVVTPEAPNKLRVQILGCVNQYGETTELDFTLGTWEIATLIEACAHGLRALAVLNMQLMEESRHKAEEERNAKG